MFWSSIGKKLLMALTGFCLCGFLITHLFGNLLLYSGKETFNAYSERLNSLGLISRFIELGLLFFAVIHVIIGAILFFQNLKARPVQYIVNKRAGGRTIGSATMPYTGFLLLTFVIFHLINFHFTDKTYATIYQIVSSTFTKPGYVTIYIAAIFITAIHIRHGFWSAFQTIGANHPKYMPVIRVISILFSIILGIGFGSIPIYMSLTG
ncbi:MAG: succinate dehydrogenase cytochrome b subunit [Desulfobacterales bacterium]|jgi:succinate dehydrogenase / fumarate reductase cytochrome b subunit|nr:succinate dehydrogenase cytochrome b subunit [Desulfobacterales bacterium]MDP6682372.1 succinate dehydrogenase cytochrome b subunit [Desulfobacterales bacterium]|tara:strand:- start:17981 stop:18604 length:624 start_codon:yes stop_codon:yes gene_type:complete